MSNIENILPSAAVTSSLNWRSNHTALLPDGVLRITPVGDTWDLWFYEKGDWGTNQYLGNHASPDDAKAHAKTWIGDDE
jgi:hypothetical protein